MWNPASVAICMVSFLLWLQPAVPILNITQFQNCCVTALHVAMHMCIPMHTYVCSLQLHSHTIRPYYVFEKAYLSLNSVHFAVSYQLSDQQAS